MACSYDFVERLPKELSIKIFMSSKYDSSNPAEFCVVSKLWRRFVIENGLCKKFCLNLCPEASKIIDVAEVLDKPERVCRIDALKIDEVLERNHRVFSVLGNYLDTYRLGGQIEERICASSYGRVPDEPYSSEDDYDYSSIDDENPTYWSSTGTRDPNIPETVVYKTICNLCIIQEIHVLPFEGNYESDFPIYSAKAVRFSFGCRSPFKKENTFRSQYYEDDMFIWMYTSPEFSMAQELAIQVFHLPRPIFCIGGIIKMELLGRAQKNSYDGLYYVSVDGVEAIGQYVPRMFDVEVVDETGNCILKCNWEHHYSTNEIAEEEFCQCSP
ncbi:F-box protein At4g00755-like [Silene latifolia]|uniref:F-box protein At4g00755-like n=1 Tax=Silene latifolia TaxID=37657 RepID=UPI003D77BB13